jgi:nickel-dependent lactate racemase
MIYYSRGSEADELTAADLRAGLVEAFDALGARRRVLAIPPDFTRFHSRAGEMTCCAYAYYGDALTDVLPALGTHSPMTAAQLDEMFPGVPHALFRVHDWRHGITTLGEIPGSVLAELSGGAVEYSWPAQVASLLVDGGHDLILSLGQVVPHEVIGMANFTKNIFVGTGGAEGINKSHFLGAAYGMERIMGRADTPVRRVMDMAAEQFLSDYPIVYALTVVGRDEAGRLVTRGLFVGDDAECYRRAAELSLAVNFEMLDRPIEKAVVYLDPSEFKSTWLGNKSIYRTRMAIADGGELVVLAPGVGEFGEDSQIDALIRKYGYVGTPQILEALGANDDLAGNLSAAAHLIHGSSEGRFRVVYCTGGLTREEVEGVGFEYGDLEAMQARYPIDTMRDGFQVMPDGEEVFYVSNPAIGLWAYRERFAES